MIAYYYSQFTYLVWAMLAMLVFAAIFSLVRRSAQTEERAVLLNKVLFYTTIRPRQPVLAPTLVTYPFIHFGIWHAIGNLVAIVQLAALYELIGLPFYTHALMIAAGAGLLTFFVGRSHTMHGGLSGVAIGLWFVLVHYTLAAPGIINLVAILLLLFSLGGVGLSVVMFHHTTSYEVHVTSAIIGILIGMYYVSWEYHAFANEVIDYVHNIWQGLPI